MNATRSRLFLLLTFLAFAPLSTEASVLLTEVMYDVSGTDTGREWVEITNTGSGSINASTLRLFESGTNHTLAAFSGGTTLSSGSSAVVADDAEKFKVDWPGYSGILLESSFSLSNSGEQLVIKDGSLMELDSVTYDPSVGAAGDGNTLQRQGSGFIAAAATPGTHSGVAISTSESTSTTQNQTQTQTLPAQGNVSAPPITVTLDTERTSLVGAGSVFDASAYGTKGEPLSNGVRYVWNFGDGTVAEGKRVFHAFRYPGTYSVQVSVGYNLSAATARVAIEAIDGGFTFSAQNDGSVVFLNTSSKDLNIGLWSALHDDKRFVIPEDTFVLAGEGVRFSPVVLGFSASTATKLFYPNGSPAVMAAPAADSPLRGERLTALSPPTHIKAPLIPLPQGIEIHDEELEGSETSMPLEAAAGTISTTGGWMPFAGLGALLAFGVAGVWYSQQGRPKETLTPADEFEIE